MNKRLLLGIIIIILIGGFISGCKTLGTTTAESVVVEDDYQTREESIGIIPLTYADSIVKLYADGSFEVGEFKENDGTSFDETILQTIEENELFSSAIIMNAEEGSEETVDYFIKSNLISYLVAHSPNDGYVITEISYSIENLNNNILFENKIIALNYGGAGLGKGRLKTLGKIKIELNQAIAYYIIMNIIDVLDNKEPQNYETYEYVFFMNDIDAALNELPPNYAEKLHY